MDLRSFQAAVKEEWFDSSSAFWKNAQYRHIDFGEQSKSPALRAASILAFFGLVGKVRCTACKSAVVLSVGADRE